MRNQNKILNNIQNIGSRRRHLGKNARIFDIFFWIIKESSINDVTYGLGVRGQMAMANVDGINM